ncbi:LamG-like jellyroll fold domain-containing protein [Clostridium sp. D53t1_180928_C8]|uniref:LamG-like jellyroll fold domain-containing protein n=1 Tax=Clostridium sp. D53t1_180928_C8 TaxID=2787101 RepID=UPI0018A97444|nr:LamG-like jellyroll fold domain-containing protein [Clostridium sp. D53t1_180928_C8]
MNFKKLMAITTILTITMSYLPGMTTTAMEKSKIPLNNLKGYWSFENYEGNTIIDDSNNSKNALIRGNGRITNDGKNNKGLELTGEKGTFLSIPSIFNLSNEKVSVSFWVNISQESGTNRTENTILLQQEGSGKSLLYYASSNQNDKLGSFVGGKNIYGNEDLTPQKWYNITLVSDYEANEVKFYVNGKFDSKHSNITFTNSNDPLRIGDHKGTDSFALNGIVDEVMIFDKNLTDEEIQNIYYINLTIEELKNELLNVINESKRIYDLANGFLDSNTLEEFLTEITLAEEILRDNNTTKEEYLNKLTSLQEINTAINEEVNTSIGNKVLIKSDVNDVFRSIDRALFGANHRYHKNGYGTYDIENLKIKDEFDKLYKESNFGALRYPGGKVANLFEWKKSIGPIENRKYTIHGDPEQTPEFPYFGVDEAAKYTEENNSEFAYVYNMGNGNKYDAADLVEYLNCEVGENPNGGVDWAEVRAENGRIEPYNVTHFELGNEFQLTSEQAYWTTASSDPLGAYINGGEFQFNNQFVVEYEDWRNSTAGKGDGTENQEKMIRYYPIVDDTLVLTVGGEPWQRVDSLENQGANNVFTYNNETGRITFGNGINGNIPASGTNIKVSYKAHRDGYVDYYEEMKKVDPNIKIYSCYDTENFITRMGTENIYDGIVIHPYSGTINSDDPKYYEKILYRSEEKVNAVRAYENKIKEILGEEKAKDVSVVVSEYGIFNDKSRFVKSQVNALYTAKSIIGFADIESVPYATKHCLVDFPGGDLLGPGGQAIIQSIVDNSTGEIDFVSTPSAKVFTLFNNLTGTNVLNESVINNKDLGNNLEAIDTMLTTDNYGNMYLMLVNAALENTTVIVDVEGFDFKNKSGIAMVVDGPSYDAENTVSNKENVLVEEYTIENIETNYLEYQLTPHSVTAIKINNEEVETPIVDKSGLQSVINKANNLSKDNYTEESWRVFEKALNLANSVNENSDATETEVNEAKTNLETAISNLTVIVKESRFGIEIPSEIKIGDFLDAKISIDNIDKSITPYAADLTFAYDHTIFELEGIESINENIIADYKILEDGKIRIILSTKGNPIVSEEKLINIKLKSKDVAEATPINILGEISDGEDTIKVEDKTITIKVIDNNINLFIRHLEIAIETAESITDEELLDVVPVVKAELESSLLEAKSLLNAIKIGEEIAQDEVNKSFNRLSKALQLLEHKGNKTELLTLVESINSLDESNFTIQSWNNLKAILNSDLVQDVLNDQNALEADIIKAYNTLNKAFLNLETKPSVDKSKLENLISKVNGLDESKYIVATWSKLQDVLENANTVLSNETATQKEVNTAYDNLMRSYLELRLKPNKDLLQDLINKVEILDSSKYTKDSWNNLETQLNIARNIINNEEATEKEIANSEKGLKSAIDALVANNEINNSNSTTPNGTNNSGNNNSLPKTGGIPAASVSLFGAIISSTGMIFLKKNGKKEK